MSKNQSGLKSGLLKFGFQNFFFSPDSKRLFLLFIINARFTRDPTIRGLLAWRGGPDWLEPVTLRLSSACSNQLSYRPGSRFAPTSHDCLSIIS